jgi:hypothetical protein
MTWFSQIRAKLSRSPSTGGYEDTLGAEWAAVTARARRDMEARRRSLAPLRSIVADISAALLDADPIGLRESPDAPDDEYDPEAETIVARLSELKRLPTQTDLLRVVHQEFVHWFGDVAGAEERYVAVAARIYTLWLEFLLSDA